jgi:GR25 family glycosyltransferase involved in LPS biosynthesis
MRFYLEKTKMIKFFKHFWLDNLIYLGYAQHKDIKEKKMIVRLLALLVVVLCSNSLCADIGKYLKKPGAKSGDYKMKNIDFIYMINLDERPEKYAKSIERLQPYGIRPFRFSAVNGWKLSFDVINNLGIKYEPSMASKAQDLWGTTYDLGNEPFHEIIHEVGRNYFCHCMSRGAIGCALSHLSVMQDALDSGYSTIWVMEDDIEVIKNPHHLSNLVEKLDALVGKKGWDILFTDQDTKNQRGEYIPALGHARRPNYSPENPIRFATRTNISPDFKKIGARYGTYSMIIRRSGIKKLLNFMKTHQLFLPIDMELFFPNDLQAYAVLEDVVSTEITAASDNGGPRYESK